MSKPAKVKYEPHTMRKLYKSVPWVVCVYCGLVGLRNDVTKAALKKGHEAE